MSAPEPVKHLFYVHSYLMQSVAETLIQVKQLPPGDCLLLFGRGLDPYLTHQHWLALTPEQSALDYAASGGERFLLLRKFRPLYALNAAISKFAGRSPFTAYLPSNKSFLMQFISTHRRCVAYHFLEEGLWTYTGNIEKAPDPRYERPWWGKVAWLLRLVNHLDRTNVVRRRQYREEPRVYGITASLRGGVAGRQVELLSPAVFLGPKEHASYDGATLLVMQPILEKGIISAQQFGQVLRSLPESLLKAGKVLVRFHPAQRRLEDYAEAFKLCGLRYDVMDGRVPLESVIASAKDLTVLGFTSTVLVQAALCGHRTLSLVDVLTRQDPELERHYGRRLLPAIFLEKVTMLC